MGYKPQEAINVFRAVSAHLEESAERLKEEGVFRVSGSLKSVRQIIDALKNGDTLVKYNTYSVHDYISALKEIGKNTVLVQPNEFPGKEIDSPESLDSFLKELIESGNSNAAEAIHTFMYLATLAASHSQENKMDRKNLGIVMGAALAAHTLSPTPTLEQTQHMSTICEKAIASGQFKNPYNQSYSAERTPVLAAQLDAEREKAKTLTQRVAETSDAITQHQQDMKKVGFFSKRTLKSEAEKLNKISTLLQDLLASNKKQIASLENQANLLSAPAASPAQRISPLMMGSQIGAKRPSQPPPPPPPRSSSPHPRKR